MTYCASLPFFERDILPHLQQVGDGRVTVLLDYTQYQASFSDFVRGAGTRYRLHPVRLPTTSANFHPKLYLLISDSKADLLVSSANLTPSGFRANAEIVDQLTLSEEQQEDAQAFAQYVAMLRHLPRLDPHLPEPLLRQIEEFASDLERLGAQQRTATKGPWFLHSIQDALLPQVGRLVPPSEINQITAISPFFDEQSLAILKLAGTYYKANIRLIKSADPGSLNGELLLKLGRRITVEEWHRLSDEQQRRLHAKILVFESDTDEWVISGSANLTRSAWLFSALTPSHPGNVEAVVVRRFPLGSATRLLKPISATKVDNSSLHRTPTISDNLGENACFHIVDAQLCNKELITWLELRTSVPESMRFRIYLEQAGKRIATVPHARRTGRRVCLSATVDNRRLDHELPIIATVEMITRGRGPERMRVWVAIPATLAFNSSQRTVRTAARDVCRKVFVQDEAAGLIADAITRFLTELGGLEHQQAARQSHEHAQAGVEETDQQVSKSEFIISDHGLGGLHSSHVRTAQALTGLAALLDRILIAADEVENAAAPADNVDETPPEDDEGDGRNRTRSDHDEERRKKTKRAAEMLDQLNTAFRETVDEALHQEVSEQVVPFVLNLPTAATAFVLLHAQVQRRLELDTGHTVTYDIRKILRDTFSTDGMILGGSYGWLIRAWASEHCRLVLNAILQENRCTDEMVAFVVAGLTLGGRLRDDDADAQAILAGLHLVCGQVAGNEIGVELRARLDAISHSSDGALSVDDLESVVTSFSPKRLDVVPLVRCWSTMRKIDQANADPCLVPREIADLRGIAPKLWEDYSRLRKRLKPTLAQASASYNGVSCQGCNQILPGRTAQRLRAPVGEYVACDYCHRILIPLSVDDGICEQIVRSLELMAEVTVA